MRRLPWVAGRLLRTEAGLLTKPWAEAGASSLTKAAAFSAARGAGAAPDSIFFTNVSGLKGNSPFLIGMMEYFSRHMPNVGFYQPIGADVLKHGKGARLPKHVAMLKSAFELPDDPSRMYGVTEEEAQALLASGRTEELMDRVFSKYQEYRKGKDLVILEGATVDGIGNLVELNGRFAAELDAPVLMIMDLHRDEEVTVEELPSHSPLLNEGYLAFQFAPQIMDLHRDEEVTAGELYNRAMISKQDLQAEHADVLGVVLNKVPKRDTQIINAQLSRKLAAAGLPYAGGIPADPTIGTARLNEVCQELDGRLLYGSAEDLDCDVNEVLVAAEDASAFLEKLDAKNQERIRRGEPPSRPLVLTSKSRADVLLSLTAAHVTGTGPHVAGIILTDAKESVGAATDRVLMHYSDQLVPVIETPTGLFETARIVSSVNPGILPESNSKIDHAKQLFSQYIDANAIAGQLALPKQAKMTPKAFIHKIHEICRADLQNIVLPESADRRVLAAAAEIVKKGLARITLLGKPAEVQAAAEKFNIDVSGCSVLDFLDTSNPLVEKYADQLVEARKAKQLTKEQAYDLLQDLNMFGTMMVRSGDADGMVSGAMCTTANTIRPALQVLKTPQKTLVSSIFFMCLPDKVLVYGDCAVNVEPTPEELAQIATVSADTAASFGITPRVAMMSYSTGTSGFGPQVDKVKAATALVKESRPDLFVEGPIQYDAAVDPAIAAQKIKGGSEVAGKANVCIFPDLNTGNNTYKAVQQSTGAIAIGPLMQGLAKPVNDLSRGCTVADIVNTVACTAVQAIGAKQQHASTKPTAAAAA
ncbi:phosphate acetyltransferase isoform A [Chlorella sorokiniana]|uniref:Phosphate acetyltransferase n=1 Tax=Chlorella sorokiniana TaxID=3076 RepID=A0A2P6TQQ1_CHLSO|nr:phosphate acetyltransferase isoform A [Chlorella sorokiniana]|eukprot:PRW56388.1 phosphate acetyltransferase isoform A [Chlorella sorokiniana]